MVDNPPVVTVAIPLERITDWESFRAVFAEVLGFPDFYGRNMDAWIDCLTSVDHPEDRMTGVTVTKRDMFTMVLEDVLAFKKRCPEQHEALVDSAAFVNWRRHEVGEPPVIALAFHPSA